jgi:hypothetical protein
MSPTTSADLSLINDTEFLDELEKSGPAGRQIPDPSLDAAPTNLDPARLYPDPSPIYDDEIDSLESGLPMDPGAPVVAAPHYDREPPTEDPYNESPAQASRERDISIMAAALVIIACRTVGAATAMLVFHDRLTRVTATPPASR